MSSYSLFSLFSPAQLPVPFLSTSLQAYVDGSLKSVFLGSQVLSQIPVQIIFTAQAQTLQQSREINHFFLEPEISWGSCTSFCAQNCASSFGEWSLLKFHAHLLYFKLSWSERISLFNGQSPRFLSDQKMDYLSKNVT